MSLARFMLWWDFVWCIVTIVVILRFIRVRRDALNPMRWSRVAVFGALATVYALGILEVLNQELNVVVARALIVPVCVVLGILPSSFRAQSAEPKDMLDAVTAHAASRLEEAMEKALENR